MAKTTAPLLSFGASGQIGKTLVAADWRGKKYMRQYVIPANPNTAAQQLTRDTLVWLESVMKQSPTLFQDTWKAYSQGLPMTYRNAFTKFNMSTLRTAANLAGMVASPGNLGGLPPASITVTAGATQLTVACTAPSPMPTGWSITSAITMVIRDHDPTGPALYFLAAMEDTSSPYSNVHTGLTTGQLYRAFAFLKWLRPDGKVAYSPSLIGSGTPT